MTAAAPTTDSLRLLLRALKLPAMASSCEELARTGEAEGWSFTTYLRHLCERELYERRQRRIERLFKGSGLPPEKKRGGQSAGGKYTHISFFGPPKK